MTQQQIKDYMFIAAVNGDMEFYNRLEGKLDEDR